MAHKPFADSIFQSLTSISDPALPDLSRRRGGLWDRPGGGLRLEEGGGDLESTRLLAGGEGDLEVSRPRRPAGGGESPRLLGGERESKRLLGGGDGDLESPRPPLGRGGDRDRESARRLPTGEGDRDDAPRRLGGEGERESIRLRGAGERDLMRLAGGGLRDRLSGDGLRRLRDA